MTAPVLGKLEWRPAGEVPELLAEPVRAALGQLSAYAAAIDPALADTAAFCAEYEVPLDASANCVVVHGKRAGESTFAAVLVLATHRADVNGVIRKHLGVRKISFAAQDDAVGRTAMEYGGIGPVGLPADWPVLIDETVARPGPGFSRAGGLPSGREWSGLVRPVVIGSGIRGSKLLVDGAELAKLPTAAVLALSSPNS